MLLRRKAQPRENLRRARRRRIGPDGLQTGINLSETVGVGFMLGFGQEPHALGLGAQHGVEQAYIVAGRILGDSADPPACGPVSGSAIGLDFAQDNLEQRGLARAIAADQADAPPGGQIRARALEDFPPGDSDHDVVESQHDGGLLAQLAPSPIPLHNPRSFIYCISGPAMDRAAKSRACFARECS